MLPPRHILNGVALGIPLKTERETAEITKMTPELRYLAYSTILGLLHLIAASHFISYQDGYRSTASNREKEKPPLRKLVLEKFGQIDAVILFHINERNYLSGIQFFSREFGKHSTLKFIQEANPKNKITHLGNNGDSSRWVLSWEFCRSARLGRLPALPMRSRLPVSQRPYPA